MTDDRTRQVLAAIDRRRRPARLSDRALSLKAGLSADFIRNIRRGKSRAPHGENLRRLARVLGATVNELLGDDAEDVTAPAAERPRDRRRDLGNDDGQDPYRAPGGPLGPAAPLDVKLLAACSVAAERFAEGEKKHELAILAYERFEGRAWTHERIADFIARVLNVAA